MLTTLFLIVNTLVGIIGWYLLWKRKPTAANTQVIEHLLGNISKDLDRLPGRTLDSITSSANTYKGRLGELIAYMDIRGSYDKIIPLGGVVDYIGWRFGDTEQDPGELVFIDVKNGKQASLSKDQRALKKIIESGNIKFLKVQVLTDIASDFSTTDRTLQQMSNEAQLKQASKPTDETTAG